MLLGSLGLLRQCLAVFFNYLEQDEASLVLVGHLAHPAQPGFVSWIRTRPGRTLLAKGNSFHYCIPSLEFKDKCISQTVILNRRYKLQT